MKTTYSVLILVLTAILLTFSVGCFYSFFYPMKYVSEIRTVANGVQLEPALLASVVNVESSYKREVISPKGAVGLMQVMPSTAKWICENINLEYDEDKLTEVEYNLRIGGYYLSYLMEKFENRDNAICAYNAGPQNVKNWLGNKEYSEDGMTLKKIPFEETQNYVKKINKNLRRYEKKYR